MFNELCYNKKNIIKNGFMMALVFLLIIISSKSLFAYSPIIVSIDGIKDIGIIIPFFSVLIGIYIATGISHLTYWLRTKTDLEKMLFPIQCFLLAIYTTFELCLYHVHDIDEFIHVSKIMGLTSVLWWYFFYLFVISYTKSSWKNGLFYLISIISLFLFVNNFISPFGSFFSDVHSLKTITFPWGERIVRGVTEVSIVRHIMSITNILILFSCTILVLKRIKKSGRAKTLILLIIFPVYAYALCIIPRLLIDVGIIAFVYTETFCFLLVILAMHYSLIHEYYQVNVRLSYLFDKTFHSILVLDNKGIVTDINRTALKVSQQRKNNLLEKKFTETIWGKDLETYTGYQTFDEIFESLKNGEIIQYETTLTLPNNTIETYDISLKSGTTFNQNNAVIVEAQNAVYRIKMEKEVLAARIKLQSLAVKLGSVEEHEKRKIADYLHDDLGQHLSLLRIRLGMFKENLVTIEEQKEIEELREQINVIIKQLRAYIFDMSPQHLYTQGLPQAIELLGNNLAEIHGFTFRFLAKMPLAEISNDIAIFVFRAIQEILVNSIKYADASNISCKIKTEKNTIYAQVEDDGVGFDLKVLESVHLESGFGLFSLKEKVNYLGGELSIKSAIGAGVNISLSIPL